jgi:hypothetical protein
VDARKRKFSHFAIATKAIHMLGDISRDEPDLCRIYDADEDNYYGMWETGFGFVDVQFPKETTRQLTKEEVEHYTGTSIAINNNPPHHTYTEKELTTWGPF